MVKKLLAVMFAATLMAGSAWAGELTWQGANGDNWGDASKWKDGEDAPVTWTSTTNDGDDAIFDGVTRSLSENFP